MNSSEAAQTLIDLASGKKKKYPKAQADRMLDLQKRMGVVDFEDPKAVKEADEEAQQLTTENADHGSTGDTLDTKPEKSKGTKTGV